MENPSHLISTLQRVFWAGTVPSRAGLPLLSTSLELAVLRPVARLKSSTLERDGRGFHIPAEMVPE